MVFLHMVGYSCHSAPPRRSAKNGRRALHAPFLRMGCKQLQENAMQDCSEGLSWSQGLLKLLGVRVAAQRGERMERLRCTAPFLAWSLRFVSLRCWRSSPQFFLCLAANLGL